MPSIRIPVSANWTPARLALLGVGLLAAAGLLADGALHTALAANPFGAPPGSAPEPQAGGVIGWLLAQQSAFYKQMTGTIRAAKSDGSAVWTLIAISFAYGVFHAAGPGHGKAVISSYLVANEESARRGIVLALVSSLLQALVAVTIVSVGAWLLNVTAKTMCSAERAIEIASYVLIIVFGAGLVWNKGGNLIRTLRAGSTPAVAEVPAGTGAADHHGHPDPAPQAGHDHGPEQPCPTCAAQHGAANAAAHTHHHHDDAAPGHAHVHDAHCGHSHGPEPGELAGPGGWSRGFGTVLAVGLRPCSGAILVLVFALAQGLFWAGVAATFAMGLGTSITVATIAILAVSAKSVARRLAGNRPGAGTLVVRGVEFAAAGLVLLFGLGLLLGYVGTERVTCL